MEIRAEKRSVSSNDVQFVMVHSKFSSILFYIVSSETHTHTGWCKAPETLISNYSSCFRSDIAQKKNLQQEPGTKLTTSLTFMRIVKKQHAELNLLHTLPLPKGNFSNCFPFNSLTSLSYHACLSKQQIRFCMLEMRESILFSSHTASGKCVLNCITWE